MSVASDAAGALLGAEAVAVVCALEALASERYAGVAGGFLSDIARITRLSSADINPAVRDLLALGLIRRRGVALLEVVTLTRLMATRLSEGAL
jgi:DNA-binding MarR family transcriptional regulator